MQRREAQRGFEALPRSKQRNKHLQTVLIEAAKLAGSGKSVCCCTTKKQRGNRNRATLAVARKLVAYLLAVDRRKNHFKEERSRA